MEEKKKKRKTNALADSQGTLLFLSVPHCRVGKKGGKTTKRLPRQGVSHAQNSRACSAINHRMCCLQLNAHSSSQHACPPTTQARMRILSPSPGRAEANKHTNQCVTAEINGGSDRYHTPLFQQRIQWARNRAGNPIESISYPLYSISLEVLFVFFILHDMGKKMLCVKPQGAQAPPSPSYWGGINLKAYKGQLLSAVFKTILSAKCPYWCQEHLCKMGRSLAIIVRSMQHTH